MTNLDVIDTERLADWMKEEGNRFASELLWRWLEQERKQRAARKKAQAGVRLWCNGEEGWGI